MSQDTFNTLQRIKRKISKKRSAARKVRRITVFPEEEARAYTACCTYDEALIIINDEIAKLQVTPAVRKPKR